MALKSKKPTEKVKIRAIGGDSVIGVSKETAEMMLRNKGEYELVEKGSSSSSTTPSGGGDGGGHTAAEKPAGNASGEKWGEYAKTLGIDVEGKSRDDIKAAVEAHEAASSKE